MTAKECIRGLWKTSDGFRPHIVACAIIGLLHIAVSLFFVFVCKRLIDIVTDKTDGNLTNYVGLMVGCMALQLLLSAVKNRLTAQTEVKLRNGLHSLLFIRLMESRWMGRERFHTGDILNRMEEDVFTVTDALCRTVPSVAVTSVQLVGALSLLAYLDTRLTGVIVFIMPVALLFSKSYVRKMRRMSHEIRNVDSHIQSHIQEHLQHRLLIRTLEYTSQAVKKLGAWQSDLLRKTLQRTDFTIFSRAMVQTGFAAGYAVAFLWGIYGLRDGSVTFGMMTAFLQLVSQVQRPMVDLSRQIPAFIRVFTSIERLTELEELPLEQQGNPIRLKGRLGIRLEHLTYSYPDGNRKVVDDFTYDFKPGSLTAIVGETGVGKSTLLKLILALLHPDKGRIVFYGDTEAEASPLTRCNLSYVPQGNTLLSGTIRDNLLIGNPQATEDEMHSALHTAAADFVFALPGGLDTLCGEQGAGLSEGQAQRIAIARGLLRPGGILLLDEPTSALDNQTEQELLKRLSAGVNGKTLLLITHRERIAGLCTEVVRMGK